jgi:EAL domain-containing protein (putative c-di-GMP-specific phosphodiesterase class I)
MAYQPIVNWRTRSVVAYEALVRTNEPELPNPGALFSIAERLGRVLELGRAIRESIAATILERGPPVDVYVNLHPQELKDESLYDPDAPLSKFAPRIVLEITEREALDESGDARGCAERLRKLGYRIAVDDLGAGYAGLNSFARLSPDIAKIDMSLIRNLHQEGVKRSLVRSITSLCRELGVKVIAEGIETPEECVAAAELGCDVLQGFLFGKPAAPFAEVLWQVHE